MTIPMTPEYRAQIAEMLARPYPTVAAETSVSALLAAGRALWDENERLRGSIAYLEAELEGHRARQREAEDALAILLTREGGSTEITQAEMASLDRRGSFVSSRTVMGGERLAYVAGEQKPTAAEQQPEDGDRG